MASQKSKQKLPFAFGGSLILRPSTRDCKVQGIRSQVLGCRPERFIIVDASAFGRASFPVDEGPLLCVAIEEGTIYSFPSRLLKHIEENMALLEYPRKINQRKLRKHLRVKLNVEVKITLRDEDRSKFRNVEDLMGKVLRGTIADISEGGCRIVARSFQSVQVQSLCSLDFVLPDGQQIEGLEAIVVASRHAGDHAYEMGLKFRGPMEQQGKLFFFCQMASALQCVEA